MACPEPLGFGCLLTIVRPHSPPKSSATGFRRLTADTARISSHRHSAAFAGCCNLALTLCSIKPLSCAELAAEPRARMQRHCYSTLFSVCLIFIASAASPVFTQTLRLQPLAEQLSESWPQLSELRMSTTWTRTNGIEGLHCEIRNVSLHPIEIDGESLPWIEQALVQFTVISADGTQLYPGRDVISFSQPVGPSYSLTIAPGQSVQGDMDIWPGRAAKLYAALAKGDLLLLWGARIRRYGVPPEVGNDIVISGATYVPKN
jgi:hypothetical protein